MARVAEIGTVFVCAECRAKGVATEPSSFQPKGWCCIGVGRRVFPSGHVHFCSLHCFEAWAGR